MLICESNLPVSKNIIQRIDSSGIKQQVVARRAGYTKQALNDMLNGRRIIRPRDISLLARALGVSPNDLFAVDSDKRDAG